MNKSNELKNIAKALAKFHASMGKVSKSANNPFFKSKYAPLPEILEAISEPLQGAGLTFSQFPDGDSLTTILIHVESGEFLEASYSIHPVKFDPQAVGSAITYARRYALGSILALNIDEDDDGNKASQPTPSQPANELPWLNENTEAFANVKSYIAKQPVEQRQAVVNAYKKKFKIAKKTEEALLA